MCMNWLDQYKTSVQVFIYWTAKETHGNLIDDISGNQGSTFLKFTEVLPRCLLHQVAILKLTCVPFSSFSGSGKKKGIFPDCDLNKDFVDFISSMSNLQGSVNPIITGFSTSHSLLALRDSRKFGSYARDSTVVRFPSIWGPIPCSILTRSMCYVNLSMSEVILRWEEYEWRYERRMRSSGSGISRIDSFQHRLLRGFQQQDPLSGKICASIEKSTRDIPPV